jgi:hypothetical protein
MISQLFSPFVTHDSNNQPIILDNFVPFRLSVVGILQEVQTIENQNVISIDDSTGNAQFCFSDQSDLELPFPILFQYIRIIFKFKKSNSKSFWFIEAARWVRKFDEIPFHIIQSMYFHLNSTQSFRNKKIAKWPMMSFNELKETVFDVIRNEKSQFGIDQRALFLEFAPKNAAEIINSAILELKADGRIRNSEKIGYFIVVKELETEEAKEKEK